MIIIAGYAVSELFNYYRISVCIFYLLGRNVMNEYTIHFSRLFSCSVHLRFFFCRIPRNKGCTIGKKENNNNCGLKCASRMDCSLLVAKLLLSSSYVKRLITFLDDDDDDGGTRKLARRYLLS